jgi:putative transposase
VSTGAPFQQAYRFALAPTPAQEAFLGACCGASRFWFNQGLALVKERLDQRVAGHGADVPWSYKGLCVAFRGAAVKDRLAPWRGEVVTGSYQAGLEALGRALQSFSSGRATGRQVGFPRFQTKGRCHEAVIFQRPRVPDHRHVDLDRRLGPLKTKESLRKLTRLLAQDPRGRVLRATVQRSGRGWVISFTVQRSGRRKGLESYVARTGRFTKTARGGQVSLVGPDQHSPVKREASSDAPRRREAPALALAG